MRQSSLFLALFLCACDPVAMSVDAGSAPTGDASLSPDGGGPGGDAGPPLDDAATPSDGGTDDGGLVDDAATDGDAGTRSDGSVGADAGPGPDAGGDPTDFVRPVGASEVCLGVACFVEPPAGDFHFNDVVPVAADAYWIAGDRGIAFVEGGVYTYLDPIAPHALLAMDGTPRDLWAVGLEGTSAHFDGVRWTRVATGVSSDLFDVWVAGDGRAYAVGEGGTALLYSAGAWRPMSLGLSGTPDLRAVSGYGDEVWIAGADRTVMHGVGGVFTTLDRESLRCDRRSGYEQHDYFAVFAAGPNDAFVSGSSLGTSPRGALVRVTDGILTCSERAVLYALDGEGPNDVWGASLDRVAHWDGFDWAESMVPAQGAIASHEGRAVAILGRTSGALAELGTAPGLAPTPIGHDYRHVLDYMERFDVSPSGVAYLSDRGVLTRRATDGEWVTLRAGAYTGIHAAPYAIDDASAYWSYLSDLGLADEGGTRATYTFAAGVTSLIPRSRTQAIVGTWSGVSVLDGGSITALADRRTMTALLVAGDDVLGYDRGVIYRLEGGAWARTDLPSCPDNELGVSQVGNESWLFSVDECVVHFRADGTAVARSAVQNPYQYLRSAVGIPGTDVTFSERGNDIARLGPDGRWQALDLRVSRSSMFQWWVPEHVAVDREHLWYATGDQILRARLDAL